MINIKPVSEIEPYMKALIYGDPGVGKTVLSATAEEHPKMKKALVLNIEGGILSISSSGADATDQIRSISEVEEIIWALSTKTEGFEQYQTLIVDSGTELQTLDLEHIVKTSIKKKGTKDREIDDIYIEDYGKSTARLKRIFRQVRDLPMNVIITALVKRIVPQSKDGKEKPPTYVGPQFTGKLANSLMGYMDFVWYMYKRPIDREECRCLLTQEEGPYKAKTRGLRFSREIGIEVVNPNISKLYQTMIESETEQ